MKNKRKYFRKGHLFWGFDLVTPHYHALSTAGKRVGDEDPLQGLWNAEGEQQLGQQLQQLFASITTSLSGELCAANNATKEVADRCPLCDTIKAKSEFK